jgi:hypothetical protein
MDAGELSGILERIGVPVLGHREDDGYLGGLVRVTDAIHVEIAPDGGASVVKALNGRDFQFYEPRTQVRELIYDLVHAGAVVLH